MGVKDLWSLLSPTGELLSIDSLSDTVLTIDLSCWICDSQNVNMHNAVTRPYLRNLFFRILSLLKANIMPIFVLEGEAPKLKWNTIESRLNKENRGRSGHSINSGKRSRLKGLINQCCELFDLIGVPWVQATGEAEATCAALCYYKIADGVVTQDSDVFLYGAEVVFRNFSANQQKSTVEKYDLQIIEKKLGITRCSMVALAVLLGCDYLPAGVPNVGKEMALKLLHLWKEKRVTDPISRMREWTSMPHSQPSKQCRDVEDIIKAKSLSTSGFPFEPIIQEFQTRLPKPLVKTSWKMPKVPQLIKWLVHKLDWEQLYAFEKSLPILTLWLLRHNAMKITQHQLQAEKIIRKRVKKGENSYEVQWLICASLASLLPPSLPTTFTTVEGASLFQAACPSVVEGYLKDIEDKRKSKKKKIRLPQTQNTKITFNKTKKKEPNKENKNPAILESTDDSLSEDELSFIVDKFMKLRVDKQDKPSNFISQKSCDEFSAKSSNNENSIICLSDSEEDERCPTSTYQSQYSPMHNSQSPPFYHSQSSRLSYSTHQDSFNSPLFQRTLGSPTEYSIANTSILRAGSLSCLSPSNAPKDLESSVTKTDIYNMFNTPFEHSHTTPSVKLRKSYSVPCFKLFDSFDILGSETCEGLSPFSSDKNLENSNVVRDSCLPDVKSPKVSTFDSTFDQTPPQLSLLDRLKSRYGSPLTRVLK